MTAGHPSSTSSGRGQCWCRRWSPFLLRVLHLLPDTTTPARCCISTTSPSWCTCIWWTKIKIWKHHCSSGATCSDTSTTLGAGGVACELRWSCQREGWRCWS